MVLQATAKQLRRAETWIRLNAVLIGFIALSFIAFWAVGKVTL